MILRSFCVYLSAYCTQFISWIYAHSMLGYEPKSKLKTKKLCRIKAF